MLPHRNGIMKEAGTVPGANDFTLISNEQENIFRSAGFVGTGIYSGSTLLSYTKACFHRATDDLRVCIACFGGKRV